MVNNIRWNILEIRLLLGLKGLFYNYKGVIYF